MNKCLRFCGTFYKINSSIPNTCLTETYRCRYSSYSGIELSSIRYPHVKRGDYGALNQTDVEFFVKTLPGRVLNDKDDVDSHNVDWLKTVRGELL